jgi:hypothetical protein
MGQRSWKISLSSIQGKQVVSINIERVSYHSHPKDYSDAKSQPQVQVALRMQQKGAARAGDVIPYVFCLAEGEETAKTAQADQAKHPNEVRRAGSELRVGWRPLFSSIPAVY